MNEYYLHVDLLVREQDSATFEDRVAKFLASGGFKTIDPDDDKIPVLLLRTPDAFQYTGNDRFQSGRRSFRDEKRLGKGDAVVRYVHIWRVPSGQGLDLARLMQLSADDTEYVALDDLVVREVQNFVTRVRFLAAPAIPAAPKPTLPLPSPGYYLRVLRQFKSADLVAYLASTGALLPMLKQNDWHSLGHFQNVTGPLNTITEFWTAPGADPHPDAIVAPLKSFSANITRRFVTPFRSSQLSEAREILVPYPSVQVHELSSRGGRVASAPAIARQAQQVQAAQRASEGGQS